MVYCSLCLVFIFALGNLCGHDRIIAVVISPDVVQPFHMCKNGELEIEVKTTATPEITTTMFDGDRTDEKDYTLAEQTDDTLYIRTRFTKKGY